MELGQARWAGWGAAPRLLQQQEGGVEEEWGRTGAGQELAAAAAGVISCPAPGPIHQLPALPFAGLLTRNLLSGWEDRLSFEVTPALGVLCSLSFIQLLLPCCPAHTCSSSGPQDLTSVPVVPLFSFPSPPIKLRRALCGSPLGWASSSSSTPGSPCDPSEHPLQIYIYPWARYSSAAHPHPMELPSSCPICPGCGVQLCAGTKALLGELIKAPKSLMHSSNYCSPTQTYFLPLPLACKSPNWFIFKLKHQFAKCRNM